MSDRADMQLLPLLYLSNPSRDLSGRANNHLRVYKILQLSAYIYTDPEGSRWMLAVPYLDRLAYAGGTLPLHISIDRKYPILLLMTEGPVYTCRARSFCDCSPREAPTSPQERWADLGNGFPLSSSLARFPGYYGE